MKHINALIKIALSDNKTSAKSLRNIAMKALNWRIVKEKKKAKK